MEYDLLLCCEGVQFSSKPVEISVDYGSAPSFGSLEYGMLDEMGDSAMETAFVACAASYAQCAISYGRTAFLYGILQAALCLSADHYLTE